MDTVALKDRPAGDEAVIREALKSADQAILWITMVQLTGDPELLAMHTEELLVRYGVMATRQLPKEFHAKLQEKALAYLLNPPAKPAPLAAPEARALMELFDGGPVSDNESQFSLEELALDGFSRPAHWTNGRPAEKLKDFHVVVVGAGISGICAAIYLKNLGIPYTVLERQKGVGGTWELNDYPEARVDISSFIYQFKFEKNYPWTSMFPPREETLEYLKFLVEKYGVADRIRLNAEVTSARWDEAAGRWDVTWRDAAGKTQEIAANVVVSASGLFSTPKLPDIAGIETFQGKMFHTTQWDHSYDYAGKRIVLIGTGSTGTQLMPALAAVAEKTTVFQRSRHWVGPSETYRDLIGPEMRWLFKALPYYWNWYGYAAYATTRRFQDNQEIDKDWQAQGGLINPMNDNLRKALTAFAEEKFKGRPDLLAKTLPTYAPLAKRSIIDNGYYDALTKPNVELVTCGIERITPTGVIDKEGVEHPADLIVLAAGFEVQKYLFPVQYEGRGGITLEQAWAKDGARAYLGLTMPGFPNFFMYYGPNGQPRVGPLHSWFEIWSRYIMNAITGIVEGEHSSVEVKRDVFEDYNTRLDAAYDGLIWKTEAPESYYINEFGRGGLNVPFRVDHYFGMIRELNLDDFEVR